MILKQNANTVFIALLVVAIVCGSYVQQASSATLGESGELDLTFGSQGVVRTSLSKPIRVLDSAIQPDGKILVVGETTLNVSRLTRAFVVRYNSDGSLDQAFGRAGVALLNVKSSTGRAVAVQPDGKIVIAGEAINLEHGFMDWIVARFHADGMPDASFGKNGVRRISFGASARSFALAIQTDGKLVVGGYNDINWTIARLQRNGRVDRTYGVRGFSTTDVGGNSGITQIALQADGRALATGFDLITVPVRGFFTTRYTANGALDASFGGSGLVQTESGICPSGFNGDQSHSIAVIRDGRVLVGGGTATDCLGTGSQFVVERYTPDGRLDPTFGVNGIATTGVSASWECDIAPTSDGGVLVGTTDTRPDASRQLLAKLGPDGQLDQSFGIGGLVRIQLDGSGTALVSMAAQADGKVVLVGQLDDEIVLTRIHADAVLPFDVCLQDDTTGNRLLANSQTGEYTVNRCDSTEPQGGRLVVARPSKCRIELTGGDGLTISAMIDLCQHSGLATIENPSTSETLRIVDRDTSDDNCACP